MTQFFPACDTFEQWRAAARRLVAAGVPPQDIAWNTRPGEASLFDGTPADSSDGDNRFAGLPTTPDGSTMSVPKAFLGLAEQVACHRDPGRFERLYRALYRLATGERHLLEIETDDDIRILQRMRKAVTRDVHKMKAFVRFRKLETDDVNGENYVAWHRPDHRIVTLAAPFFARRFRGMNWTILTPDESATWDGRQLRYGAGVPVSEAPQDDALEDLWRTYYASIFNPARVKVKAMKAEMPVRHWATLPEAELIPDLLRDAGGRVDSMIESAEGFAETAAGVLPADADLSGLAAAARRCRACDLHEAATQTVFGRGPATARVMLVGEQPGDQEDRVGEPFVGPAGEVLRESLAEAGIDVDDVYLTNVVKHFKFTPRGKRRIHQKPGAREIFACRPWLEAEIAQVRPETLVCLGATAAQALLGRDFRITKDRGKPVASDWCSQTIATWHPAAILRTPDGQRRAEMRMQLVADLRSAR